LRRKTKKLVAGEERCGLIYSGGWSTWLLPTKKAKKNHTVDLSVAPSMIDIAIIPCCWVSLSLRLLLFDSVHCVVGLV
jgi:hypothetical protein